MTIKEARKELKISNTWIANKFGYSNVDSYNRSSGKPKVEKLIVELYKKFKESNTPI